MQPHTEDTTGTTRGMAPPIVFTEQQQATIELAKESGFVLAKVPAGYVWQSKPGMRKAFSKATKLELLSVSRPYETEADAAYAAMALWAQLLSARFHMHCAPQAIPQC